MDTRTHWEKIYTTKAPDQVSWYRPHLETSIDLIERSISDRSAPIIDIGGGESTLVDDLLAERISKRHSLGCFAGSDRRHQAEVGTGRRSSSLGDRRYHSGPISPGAL